jgi:hypothetical protein
MAREPAAECRAHSQVVGQFVALVSSPPSSPEDVVTFLPNGLLRSVTPAPCIHPVYGIRAIAAMVFLP